MVLRVVGVGEYCVFDLEGVGAECSVAHWLRIGGELGSCGSHFGVMNFIGNQSVFTSCNQEALNDGNFLLSTPKSYLQFLSAPTHRLSLGLLCRL